MGNKLQASSAPSAASSQNISVEPLSSHDDNGNGDHETLKRHAMDEKDFSVVDLSNKGLRTIPTSVLTNAVSVLSLDLSGNCFLDLSNRMSLSKFTNVTCLQLNNCGLSELPEELFNLVKLEKLSLRDNKLARGLSPSISELKALKYLNICYCDLKHLPEELWTFEKVEKLSLQGNKLAQGLSPSISKLKALKNFNIGYCELKHLPEELWTLEKLQILNLSNNRLVEFPAGAVVLPNLKLLDLSNWLWQEGNKITELPESLKDSCIESLLLNGNPIIRPPEAIWKQGVQAIKLYFEEVTAREQKQLCVDTINMIGESEAGKTSIARSLVEGKPITAAEDDRTRVMQRLQAILTANSSDSPVYVNDFGGHHIYRSFIPLFLPCNGLVILAYNLMATDWRDQEKKVKGWLLTAIAKSTKIRLIVAGTRSDLAASCETASAMKTDEKMQSFLLEVVHEQKIDVVKHIRKLTSLQQKADDNARKSSLEKRLNDLKTLKIKLEEADLSFATVSCNESYDDFHEFRTLVCNAMKQPEIIPARWWQVMEEILKVDHSGFPRRTMEQTKDVYRKYVSDDPRCKNLPVILSYLANSSQIIWVENDPQLHCSIFHSPQKIVDICMKILDHRAVENQAEDQAVQLATEGRAVFAGGCTPRLPPEWRDASEVEKKRYKRGIIQESLLKKLLFQYKDDEITEIIAFMEHFDLISEIKISEAIEMRDLLYDSESTEGRAFIITSTLPEEEPPELKNLMEQYHEGFSSVFVSLSFVGCIIPFAFFATTLSSIIAVAQKQCCGRAALLPWKCGLCVRFDTLVLLVKCHEEKREVTFTAHSKSSSKQSPWFLLYPVLERLQEKISASWPGVAPEWQIMCPGCMWLKEHGCAGDEISRKAIFFKDFTSHLQEDARSKCELQVFEDCSHFVPRSLCHSISKDSFTEEEQKQIAQFYEDLHVERKNKNRPVCEEPSSRRRNFSEPALQKESGAVLAQSNSDLRLSSQEDVTEVVRERMPLRENLRTSSYVIAERLSGEETDAIIALLRSAKECCLVTGEYEKLKKITEATKKATELLDILHRKDDHVILYFAQLLQNIGRKSLHNLLLYGSENASGSSQ